MTRSLRFAVLQFLLTLLLLSGSVSAFAGRCCQAETIEDVQGMVEITADGSGPERVEEVSGNFQLRNLESGDIRTSGIEGDIDIPR